MMASHASPRRLSEASSKTAAEYDEDSEPAGLLGSLYRARGKLLILFAEFLVSVMHLITRYLQKSLPEDRKHHALHLLVIRSAPTILFCLGAGYYQKIPHFPLGRRDIRGILWLRSIAGFCGMFGYFSALKTLPLADATILSFLVPTVVSIACALLPALREPFTRAEQISAAVSFLGVVLVARPGFLSAIFPDLPPIAEDPDIPAAARLGAVGLQLLGVCGAATAYTAVRWVGDRAHSYILILYFATFTTFMSTVIVLSVPGIPNFRIPEGWFEWAMVTGLAGTGFLVQWALTRGLQIEKAGRGMQLMYVQIVFATLFEWAVWGDVPDAMTWLGGVVIVGSVAWVSLKKEKKEEETVDYDEADRPLLDDGEPEIVVQ